MRKGRRKEGRTGRLLRIEAFGEEGGRGENAQVKVPAHSQEQNQGDRRG